MAGLEEPLHIPLPNFTLEKANKYRENLKHRLSANQLRVRDAGAPDHGVDCSEERAAGPFGSRKQANREMAAVLRGLWVEVVKPILEALAFHDEYGAYRERYTNGTANPLATTGRTFTLEEEWEQDPYPPPFQLDEDPLLQTAIPTSRTPQEAFHRHEGPENTPPSPKRAGKQPIYYELNSLSVGFSVFTPFQQYLQQRVQHGEVVLRSRELAETQHPEYERLRREQELRQLREIVAQVAREDRLEGRLTTIILFDTQGRMLTDIATQVDAVLLNTHSRILHAQPLPKSAFTVQPAKLHSAPT
ncbi:hypothetical protein NMY22_g19007 [Coprinellus aureogranulatus]|nr:hypothetical protein NMY22_g19007 [Coprinellus aureogranulatus]